jgi:hypothetical protein
MWIESPIAVRGWWLGTWTPGSRWRFIYGIKRKEKNGHSCFQVAFQRLGLKTDPLKKKIKADNGSTKDEK